jgi:hypothetical protein
MSLKRRACALRPAAFLILSLAALQAGRADDAAPADKSMYSLLNPTPADAMRAFSPERPAKILNPFTVDAGHFQIESDFLSYTHTNYAAGRSFSRQPIRRSSSASQTRLISSWSSTAI